MLESMIDVEGLNVDMENLQEGLIERRLMTGDQ